MPPLLSPSSAATAATAVPPTAASTLLPNGCGAGAGQSQLFIAPYADERQCHLPVAIDPVVGVSYRSEQPGDRDVEGILWERWEGTESGPVQWALHLPARQREVMEKRRCAACAGEPDRRPGLGVLWLLDTRPVVDPDLPWPRDVLTANPPLCLPDARWALNACVALREGFVALRVREVETVGVIGTVYSPTGPPQTEQLVLLADARIRFTIARQLVVRLCDAVPDPDFPAQAGPVRTRPRRRASSRPAPPGPVPLQEPAGYRCSDGALA